MKTEVFNTEAFFFEADRIHLGCNTHKCFRLYDRRDACYCCYRHATADEIAELVAKEAIEADRAKGFKRLSKIGSRIQNGERPKDINGQISGEHIAVDGSGVIVISTDYIWHLHNCGVKNVGNFGDLCAWRIPYHKKLAAEVNELADRLKTEVRAVADESAQSQAKEDAEALKAAISKQIGCLNKKLVSKDQCSLKLL